MKYNWFSLKCLQFNEWVINQRAKLYNKVKEYVFNKEIERWSTQVHYNDYCSVKLNKSNPNYWVFNPVEVVTYVLKMYFNSTPTRFYDLKIFGINVDTQNETVDVTIKLRSPGWLIGRGGKDINEVEKRLRTVFNMPTKIHIEEIRYDINEPFICY